jgi:hypothetical protein
MLGNNLLEKFVLDYLPVAKDGFLQIRRGKCFPYTRLQVTVKNDLKRKKHLERLHQRLKLRVAENSLCDGSPLTILLIYVDLKHIFKKTKVKHTQYIFLFFDI